VTVTAESFGTNIRAVAVTTVPNVVRTSVLLFTFLLKALKPALGVASAAGVVGLFAVTLAFIGLVGLKESFSKELNYLDR
jgi:hypothetical protein